ncbi:thiamine phosphate synthase [Parvularcula dongshanensis]|uniref:Thiamine-phosphate synthase n=1 Tax=Parvularcula dongshanensis TaxID=1173995 RepID=A0A840I7W2_9PROT|nr:thiamine-phosphate pyrophosphorylase [Parvularcula dongshanensis]
MTAALYLITPPKIDAAFEDALTEALDAGLGTAAEVACLQLRLKDVADDEVLRAGEALLPICRARGVAFLVNDRADLAKRLGADGVHLGQTDGSVREARGLLGPDADIGVTCHDSYDLAMKAGEEGADYVAFGAFFPTATKETVHRPDPDILTSWSMMTVLPCVAIGGITPENCRSLARAGADYLAVSGAVWNHAAGPGAAVAAFAAALREPSDAA